MRINTFDEFVSEKLRSELVIAQMLDEADDAPADDDDKVDADTTAAPAGDTTTDTSGGGTAAPAPDAGGGTTPPAGAPQKPKKEDDDYAKLNHKLTDIIGKEFKPKKDDHDADVYTVPLAKFNRHKVEKELEDKVGHPKNMSSIGSHGKRWAKDQHGIVDLGIEVLAWEENGKVIMKVSKLMPSKIGGW